MRPDIINAPDLQEKINEFLADCPPGLTLCRENPQRFEEFTRQMVPVLTPGSQMAGRGLRQDRQELALMTGGGTGDENEILSRLGVSQDAFRKTLQREGG